METSLLLFVFSLSFALLLLHEMDAIRAKEWRMFIILKDMEEKRAFQVFTLLHLPLYAILLYSFIQQHRLSFVIVDVFLIVHAIAHFFFEKHPQNQFKNGFSRFIIHSMGMLALLHLLGIVYL
ncbi:DUF6713 family protein [Paenibacillus sp. 598K]|uniref:DUF6713 family protein n=1 Tax=Paenibacillus sp. 598K TaxID=1117987 RepID=UPI0021AA4AB3|nr:DUF6713 family protein [Paenibacillus sp. 598K]